MGSGVGLGTGGICSSYIDVLFSTGVDFGTGGMCSSVMLLWYAILDGCCLDDAAIDFSGS